MRIVLFEPEIPWNTGNIGRTCVGTGTELHLIGHLGFDLSEKEIRRSGLDYWPRLKLFRHENLSAFEAALPQDASVLAFVSGAGKSFWEAPFREDSYLLFGRESTGLPLEILKRYAFALYRIPMASGERSLNLSTAAAVALYEGLRRLAR